MSNIEVLNHSKFDTSYSAMQELFHIYDNHFGDTIDIDLYIELAKELVYESNVSETCRFLNSSVIMSSVGKNLDEQQ